MDRKEESHQYYLKNKESILAKAKVWYQNNKEKKGSYNRLWNKRNPDRIKAHNKRYRQENKEYLSSYDHKRRIQLKEEVLTYYGGGKLACSVCGESRLPCLSIDHIDGGGGQHKLSIRSSGGVHLYTWLKEHNYPEGYMTLCMNCQFYKREVNKEYPRGRNV